MRPRPARSTIVIGSLVAFLCACMPLRSMAALLDTPTAIKATHATSALERVDAALRRADIAAQLQSLGVDREQALSRAAALTEAELEQLAGQLESLPAGGDVLAVVGLVFVVLMILEFVGVIDIFKK